MWMIGIVIGFWLFTLWMTRTVIRSRAYNDGWDAGWKANGEWREPELTQSYDRGFDNGRAVGRLDGLPTSEYDRKIAGTLGVTVIETKEDQDAEENAENEGLPPLVDGPQTEEINGADEPTVVIGLYVSDGEGQGEAPQTAGPADEPDSKVA